MLIRVLLLFCIFLTSTTNLNASEWVSIGCILPLSGKFAPFGNKALHGLELAVERYNSAGLGKRRPVKLLIKDSQALPEVAEKAVNELDRDGVSLIIGPILGVTSGPAARKAQQLGIPIITMTQKEGITSIGDKVFRNCITNSAQVKGLAGYAAREGIKRVAVLYPDNQYGRELNSLFISEFAKIGGKVVVSQSYKETQTDFGQEIKALVGKKRLKDADRFTGGFDAIFIPDYHERVGLIVPQLAFYDLKGIKLLGASGWNSPDLLKLAGGYLGNSVFTDGFFSGNERPHVKEFVEQYRKTFGEEPGILEAQAYDTAGMVFSVIADGISSREGIRAGVNKIKDYSGVSGDITFKGRDAERTVYLLTVRNGEIEEVGP